MRKAASLACNSNNCPGALPRDNHHTSLRTQLYPILAADPRLQNQTPWPPALAHADRPKVTRPTVPNPLAALPPEA